MMENSTVVDGGELFDAKGGIKAIREFDADEDAREREFDLGELAESDSAPLWERIVYPVYWEEKSQDVKKVGRVQVAGIEERSDELDAVVVSDYADCDGRGAAGIYVREFGNDMIYVPASHRGSASAVLPMLEDVAEAVAADVPIYVTDLAPNEEQEGEYISAFNALGTENPLHIRDHHQWPDEVRMFAESVAESMVIDHDRCATEIVFDEDCTGDDGTMERLAELTGIRDLWKDDHPDFDEPGENLVNAAFSLDFMQYARLVARVGANVTEDEQLGAHIRQHRAEKDARVEIVAETARWGEFGGYCCAFAYGDCYSSGVGAALQERGADIAVIVTPNGKVSIRTRDDVPVAETVASELGGGGHPNAAGCNPITLRGDDKDVGYLDLWTSRGLPVHMIVADTINRLPYSEE